MGRTLALINPAGDLSPGRRELGLASSACTAGQLKPGEMKSSTVRSLTDYTIRAQASCPPEAWSSLLEGAAVQALWNEGGRLSSFYGPSPREGGAHTWWSLLSVHPHLVSRLVLSGFCAPGTGDSAVDQAGESCPSRVDVLHSVGRVGGT